MPRGHHSTTLSRLHVARSLLLLSFLLTATEDGASHLQNTHHPGCHMGRETSPAPCQRGRTAGTTRDSQARSISSPLQALDSKPVCTMHSDSSPFNLSFISPHCLQNVWWSPAQLPWSDGQTLMGRSPDPPWLGPPVPRAGAMRWALWSHLLPGMRAARAEFLDPLLPRDKLLLRTQEKGGPHFVAVVTLQCGS